MFFNSQTEEETKGEIKLLIREVCERIEKYNAKDLVLALGNIEFIVYKQIEDLGERPYGGETGILTFKNYIKCFMVYFCPLIGVASKEARIFALAHEFAHAFYGHPFEKDQSAIKKRNREDAADKKSHEWGFNPN